MSCETGQVNFDQYVDAELAGNEAAEFQAHLLISDASPSDVAALSGIFKRAG
jgi:hypothetical protein